MASWDNGYQKLQNVHFTDSLTVCFIVASAETILEPSFFLRSMSYANIMLWKAFIASLKVCYAGPALYNYANRFHGN